MIPQPINALFKSEESRQLYAQLRNQSIMTSVPLETIMLINLMDKTIELEKILRRTHQW